MENRVCPICGNNLKKKIIKKQKTQYRRGLRSFICSECNYSEYDSNPREKAITEGRI